jgi:hypothetical protein
MPAEFRIVAVPRQRKFRSRRREGEKMGMACERRTSPMVLGVRGAVNRPSIDLTAERGLASVKLTAFDLIRERERA